MRRLLEDSLVVLGLTATAFGCASAPVVEFTASPALVCPGEVVRLRVLTEGHSGGSVSAAPPVAAGVSNAPYGDRGHPWVEDREVQICETTTFTAKFWSGSETACGADYTTCVVDTVSVLFEDVPVMRSVPTCRETAEFDITDADFGTLVIRNVSNCTGGMFPRPVELTSRDGGSDVIPPGGSSSAFTGRRLTGSYTARRTVIPPEGCPPEFETVPGPRPPAPPPICLIFTAGCEVSDDCDGG